MAKGRKTGGRQRGTANKVTREIREYAQTFTKEALDGLANIARNSASDACRRHFKQQPEMAACPYSPRFTT